MDIVTTISSRNTSELMPPSRISLLPVRLSLALFVNLKLLQRRFISDPEVHLMGSELIGFLLSFWLSLNPDGMLFSFWGLCFFLYLPLFALLVSILGHTNAEIIINGVLFSGNVKVLLDMSEN